MYLALVALVNVGQNAGLRQPDLQTVQACVESLLKIGRGGQKLIDKVRDRHYTRAAR